MTTYLAIDSLTGATAAFCSDRCRYLGIYRIHWTDLSRDDDGYEFVEICAYCGADTPSSFARSIYEEIELEEREILTTEEAARRLRARYAPGYREEVKFGEVKSAQRI